ncbi:MAG: hypothetical protein K0S32_230 [Bacteroidetes bacterium]|jgi:hypothetical protein|nr:hypothetical protein [Bacteroidota bacterium]
MKALFLVVLQCMLRDIFWTVIIVWLIYKIVDIFKSAGQKKKYAYGQQDSTSYNNQNNTDQSASYSKKDVKSAVQKRADKEGEYVDFEDVK